MVDYYVYSVYEVVQSVNKVKFNWVKPEFECQGGTIKTEYVECIFISVDHLYVTLNVCKYDFYCTGFDCTAVFTLDTQAIANHAI